MTGRARRTLQRTSRNEPMEASMSSQTLSAETLVSVHSPDAAGTGTSRLRALNPLSPAPTYIGIVLVAVGFVLLAITWGQVAAQTNVAAQLPYFVSGGMVGLGLIMTGLTTVSVASKRRDAQLRAQQVELLAAALDELGRDNARG